MSCKRVTFPLQTVLPLSFVSLLISLMREETALDVIQSVLIFLVREERGKRPLGRPVRRCEGIEYCNGY